MGHLFLPKRIWHIVIILVCCIDSVSLQACRSPVTQTLDKSSGNISSHNSTESNLYPSNARCTWVIKVPLGHVIKLTFLTFQLEPDHDGCKNDSITVRSGQSPTSDLMGTFCGFSKPPVLVSLEQFMWVSFITNEYGNFDGFRASFTAVKIGVNCSARNSHEMNNNILLRDSNGMLSGPLDISSSEFVANSLQCTWRVVAPTGYGIKLSFAAPLFGSNQNNSSLEIHKGFLHASTLAARIQGIEATRPLPIIYIPTNHMWARLNMPDGQSIKDTNVAANYQAVLKDSKTCSYVNSLHENGNIHLQGTTGEISSPNYPNVYGGKIKCIWQINVPLGFRVKLTFTSFDSHSCTDKLEVREGLLSSSPLMGSFCGPVLPPDLYTHGRSMWLRFIVRSSGSFKGFHARYSAVTTAEGACSKFNTEEMNINMWKNLSSGRFVSPRYPAKYPSDAKCVWRIAVPRTFRIKLQFTHFDLEEHACKYDFVEVRDGLNLNSPLIGGRLLCGRIHHDTAYYSSGPHMLVSFASDASEQFFGFEALYSVVLPELDKCSPVNTIEENNNIHVSGRSGVISSPNFPGLFPNNIQCTWTVTVPPDHRIVYQVSSFHLESSCSGEYLDVRDGSSSSSPHQNRYCGNMTPFHVLSTRRSMWIRFKTNSYLRFAGFNSSFIATPTGPNACSRDNFYFTNNNIRLNGTSGQLSSAEFPLPYSRESQCTWVLEARAGYRIELTFSVVDLPTSCVNHYIEVCDGRYSCKVNAYIVCGSGHRETTKKRVYSRGQFLWVRFKASSDSGSRFTGFKATYQQVPAGVCSHSYSPTWNQNLWLTEALSGSIASPGYPGAIRQPIQCYWKISVPSGRTIKLFFQFFHLPPSCNESCIRVYDGLDPSKPLIARMSGRRVTRAVFSSGRSLLLQFEASSSLTNSGVYKFKAFYLGLKTSVGEVGSSTGIQLTSVIIGVIIVLIVLLGSFTLGCMLRKTRRAARAAARHSSSLSRVSSFHETSNASPQVMTLNLRRLPEVEIPNPSPEVTRVDSIPELPMINDLSDLNVVEERPPPYNEAVQSDSDSQETISRSVFDDEPEPEPEPEVEREDEGPVEEEQGGDLDGLGLENRGFVGSTLQLDDQPPAYDTLFRTRESRNT